MTTQYTPILKLALPVQGELSGTWGDVVNDNITSMIEQAIAGRSVVNTWTANSHVLTTANGTAAESRAAMLSLTDTGTALTGAGSVVCPALSKTYIVKNGTAQVITVKTASGSGIAVPVGKTMLVYCDGTNVLEGVDHVVTLSAGTLTITGLTTFASLKGADATTVTGILDEDNMASDSATKLVTQQSVKAYVDSQVGANNELSEVLANGNTTGSNDIDVDAAQKVQFRDASIYINSSADGQLDIVADTEIQIATATVDLNGNLDVSGTALVTGTLDVDGATQLDSTLTVGVNDTGHDVKFFGATSGAYMLWDESADNLILGGTAGLNVVGTATFTTVTMDGLTVDGDSIIKGGSGVGNDTATLQLESTEAQAIGSGASVSFKGDDGTGARRTFGVIKGSKTSATSGDFSGGLDFFTRVTAQPDATKRLAINSNGDISFYEDTGTTPKLFWDASAESLGIGTASPDVKLHLSDSTSGSIIRLERNDTAIVSGDIYGGIEFEGQDASTSASGVRGSITGVGAGGAGNMDLVFNTAKGGTTTNLQRLRISSIGDISFYEDTGTTAKLLWDASAESLAIGTGATSAATLNAYSKTVSTNLPSALRVIENTGASSYWDIGSTGGASNNLNFYANANTTPKLTLTGAGNVGIGTSSPNGQLTISDGSLRQFEFYPENSADTNLIINYDRATSTYQNLQTRAATHQFLIGSNERMRIDASGNVGIGVGNSKEAMIQSTNSGRVASNPAYSFNGDLDTGMFNPQTDNTVAFATGGTERLRINSSGQVSIGSSFVSGVATRVLTVDDPSNAAIVVAHNGATALNLYADADEANIGSYLQGANMKFFTTPSGGSTTERMRIDSAGIVSIGSLSNAGGSLGVNHALAGTYPKASGIGLGATSTAYTVASNGGTVSFTGGVGLYAENTASSGNPTNLVFWTNHAGTPAEAMRLDSLGRLLVGTTNPNPHLFTSGKGFAINQGTFGIDAACDDIVGIFNRTETDGTIVEFKKDGTAVGSIGSVGGANLSIKSDDGVLFIGGDQGGAIRAINGIGSGQPRLDARDDATTDLGTGTNRFKDLYLSGGVYLGGTGAANKLDDYEEGTWTPTSGVALTVNQATYTKIGRMVHIIADIQFATSSSGSGASISLPFAGVVNSYNSGSMNYTTYTNNVATVDLEPSGVYFRANQTGNVLGYASVSDKRFIFSATYFTTL
jgi:hypothetical protein